MDRGISILLVFLGGGLGSVIRYFFSIIIPSAQGVFPWGTLLVNVLASFIIGIVAGSKWMAVQETYRLLVAVGFCGGLSTFSTFALEGNRMLDGQFWSMMAYYLLSCILCLVLVRLGMKMAI
jgi:CrcB protein